MESFWLRNEQKISCRLPPGVSVIGSAKELLKVSNMRLPKAAVKLACKTTFAEHQFIACDLHVVTIAQSIHGRFDFVPGIDLTCMPKCLSCSYNGEIHQSSCLCSSPTVRSSNDQLWCVSWAMSYLCLAGSLFL